MSLLSTLTLFYFFLGTMGGTQMQSVQLSEMIRSDVRSVQILVSLVTIGKSNNSNANLDQDYCICDNVNFSIMRS
jgi:hypothetical protein